MNRRVGRGDLDHRLGRGDAAQHLGAQLPRRGVERHGQPIAAGVDVADELGLFGPGAAEPHRLGVAVERVGDVDQIGRLIAYFGRACLHQPLDETPQPERLGIRDNAGGFVLQDLGHSNSPSRRRS